MATYNLPCHLSGSGDCDGSPSTFTTTVVTNSASLGDDSLRCHELGDDSNVSEMIFQEWFLSSRKLKITW